MSTSKLQIHLTNVTNTYTSLELSIISIVTICILYLLYRLLSLYLAYSKLNSQLSTIPTPPSRYPFSQFIDLISSNPWRVLGNWMSSLHTQIIRFQFGTYTYIVVSDPNIINHIFMNINNYHKDLAAMKPFLVLLGNGLVTSRDTDEEKIWSSQRKLITPVLRSDVLDQTAQISIDATDRLIDKLMKLNKNNKVGLIGICDEYRHLTLQVIGNAILSLSPTESSSTFPDLYLPIAEEANARVYFPLRKYIPSTQLFKYHTALRELNTYIQAKIEDRYSTLKSSFTNKSNDDHKIHPSSSNDAISILNRDIDILDRILLQLLRDGSEWNSSIIESLRDQIKTFVLAGHETTSMMLTWATWELMNNPHCMAEVKREAAALWGNNLLYNTNTGNMTDKHSSNRPNKQQIDDGLLYTKAVLMETLRKWSVVPLVVRESQNDDILPGNISIPKGTCVAVNIWQTHHDSSIWPDPDKFDPTRFIDMNTKKYKTLPHLCAYLPFIQGPRNCVGQHFALLEAKIVLSRIMLILNVTPHSSEKGEYHKINIPITPNERMKIHYSLDEKHSENV